jgi:hypothetical protein
MFKWIQSLFAVGKLPQPAGPPELICRVGPMERPIAEGARWDGEELLVAATEADTLRLFEVPIKNREQCQLAYRFRIKTDALKASVYPEMWCRIPGIGECFSRGLNSKVRGTNDWMSVEIPFYLQAGQQPDLLKLNLVFEGSGHVRLKEIEVAATPLEAW